MFLFNGVLLQYTSSSICCVIFINSKIMFSLVFFYPLGSSVKKKVNQKSVHSQSVVTQLSQLLVVFFFLTLD
jgi:hypothetical protein